MDVDNDKEAVIFAWKNTFKRATDFDAWGQPIEAIDLYDRLSKQLKATCDEQDGLKMFELDEKKTLEKIGLCVDSRKSALQMGDSHQSSGVSLFNLRQLEQTFLQLLSSDQQGQFPVDVSLASAQLHRLSIHQSPVYKKGEGTLLPKPLPITGKTLMTVLINRIDMKDTSHFLDPFITVSVRDLSEVPLTASQDTPVTATKTDSEICFGKNVHIQKTIESLPPGFAIFFEFKHFKPKKGTTSTKCWAFLEQDEIKEGALALEIYRKPTDYSRKALKLLSTKPRYLHLKLTLFR